MIKASRKRSLIKSITWRACATLTTMLLILLFTGSIKLTLSIGVLEMIVKLIVYYGHERLWNKIAWGRKIWKNI